MMIDYIFIGGGVTNLAAANYLLDSGESNILVIERGRTDAKEVSGRRKKYLHSLSGGLRCCNVGIGRLECLIWK